MRRREAATQDVLLVALENGPLTAAEIVLQTGLPRDAVTAGLRRLRDRARVVEHWPEARYCKGHRGRVAVVYESVPDY